MPELCTIYDYMRAHAALLGDRILQEYPALHQFDHPVSTRITGLLRTPFPAQTIAIMGVAKRWQHARTSMVVAECGTGKTLIALGAIHVHSQGSPFTALAMVPPHLVEKWAREAFLTLPGIRVFLIDDLRNGGDENKSHGVNEVRLRQGRIVREGLHKTLSELRLRKGSPSSRKRWLSLCGRPSLFIVGRERAKLGYFWRHAYRVPHSGPYVGCIVNSDTGKPVIVDESRLTAGEFEKVKIAETIETRGEKSCRPLHSPLWQADADKIRRMAPIEFIGRYMPEWFDYAICDEIHQLAGDTAQGNALGTLASCTDRIVGLTEDQPPALHDRPRRWRIGAASDDHHSRWQPLSQTGFAEPNPVRRCRSLLRRHTRRRHSLPRRGGRRRGRWKLGRSGGRFPFRNRQTRISRDAGAMPR